MQEDIRTFLSQHNKAIEPLHGDYSRSFWEMSLAGTSESVDALVAAKGRYLDIYRDRKAFERLKSWRKERSSDLGDLTARELDCAYLDFLPYQMDADVLKEIVYREAQIEKTFNTFRADLDNRKVSDNEMREMLGSLEDIDQRRRVWEASKQVGEAVAEDLVALVELRNKEAARLGFADYYALMLETQELDEGWLFSLLDELESASEDAFVNAKTDLDQRLKQRFRVPAAASHPWLYSDPFFQELPSMGVTDKLDAIFEDQNLEELTRRHFQSLGMEIDDLLRDADLYERDGKSQHAFCLDVDRMGDIRVLCNICPNERWMSVMLHEFGHAVYDKYNDRSLPFALRRPAHTFTTEAVAMLNGRMTKTPSWLVRFAGVSPETAAEMSGEIFQALRGSMLVFVRWALTLVRFERELYRDPRQDLGPLWWNLVERIQKVRPPQDRTRADWASKIHLAVAPVYYHNYILGELMASQVLDYVGREVAPDGDIFTGQVGAYMTRQLFEPGARWAWNSLLERATGEGLTPRHFLRQFDIA